MGRAIQRTRFYLDYCTNFSPAQLMQMWWIYQHEKRGLKVFAEWCFAKAVLKLKALEHLHTGKKRFLAKAEQLLISGKLSVPCGCERINLRYARLERTSTVIFDAPLGREELADLIEEFR